VIAACTFGAIDPKASQSDVTSTICTRGYTAAVRPRVGVSERIKREQMAAYGPQSQRLEIVEIDHLIALDWEAPHRTCKPVAAGVVRRRERPHEGCRRDVSQSRGVSRRHAAHRGPAADRH
jgi:hypothetical protein